MGTDVKSEPLKGLRVVEFSHMVMGPAAGLILADLGADVIKIEPLGGDKTRVLKGSGAGYFPMYNRNKKSIAIDLKQKAGLELAQRLCADADILIENFRSGAMAKLGLDYDTLRKENPRLIYCSEKGFLPGPYEDRTALDEVAQMMTGLAYMTGPPGQPLRAGASVVDVLGGAFGVIGILSAIIERAQTGRGQPVTCGLYESSVFLVGQHMAQYAVTGVPANPMPARISAWSVYDIFSLANEDKIFIGIVSDGQWQSFCSAFDLTDWRDAPDFVRNNQRVERRDIIMPRLRALFADYSLSSLAAKLDQIGLPFAPIRKPEDLFEDPHLLESEGLVPLTMNNGVPTHLPALPIEMSGHRLGMRLDVPAVGEHGQEILESLGFDFATINGLINDGILEVPDC